ncbi:MAG: lipoate--protein ligase family protein [Acidiferrobacterales bacterium]
MPPAEPAPDPVPARFLDLGTLAPDALHAAYHGLALAQDGQAQPVLAWARSATAHVCIGQSQSARAELDLEACAQAGVPVVRRPLGGGTVLVDGDQRCVFFILPVAFAAARPASIFGYCLAPLVRTFRSFGIDVRPVGRADLWAADAKITGSGAATLGRCMVFGSSFVLRFPDELFCSLLNVPSPGFRIWLREILPVAFTSWERLGNVPSDAELAGALCAAVAATLGWNLRADTPSEDERRAMCEAADELRLEADDDGTGRRRVANGIKLNAATYLAECHEGESWLRVLLRNGKIGRIDTHDPGIAAALGACIGSPVEPAALEHCLARVFSPEAARSWALRILTCLAGAHDDDDSGGRIR